VAFQQPLEGAFGIVIDLDFFGADSGFAFEFPGGHEEVKKRDKRLIDGGQEGLFLKALQPVAAHIVAHDGAVLLLYEAVVVHVTVAAAGAGEGEVLLRAPDIYGVVDELRSVVAVELQDREEDRGSDVREGLEGPFLGVIEQGTQFDPAGADIRGGEGV
jgi:hypothetical protein